MKCLYKASNVMYLCARGIHFDSFCDFSIGLWSYSDSAVFFFWLSYRDDMQYAMHHNYVKNKTDYEIMLKQWWKKYHQYQQSVQSSLNSTHCMQTYHELWRGKSRSWPGKAQQCSWFSYNHDVLHSGLLLTRCYWNNTAYIEAITNDLVNNFGISVPQMTTY